MTNGEMPPLEPNRGPLYVRSILKLTIVLFIATQFLTIHPFISLIIIAVAYFTMPTSYSEDQPWKMIEAWLRLYFGFMMAILLFAVLSGQATVFIHPFFLFYPMSALGLVIVGMLTGVSAVALFWLTLAFFCTLPEHKKPVGEVEVKVDILGKAGRSISGFGITTVENIFFLVFALIGGIPILTSWLTGAFQQIFTIIYVLGLFMGWFARGEGRPYVGVLVIGIAILAFSFQFTGTVGVAAFGAWWPTVYHYGSMVAEPIGAAWSSAATSMQDVGLMLTCPSCYWAKQLQQQQVETGKVTTGGTTRSIELTNFEAINYMTATPEIDPLIPLIGSIEIENQGEFTASNVEVNFNIPKIKNPEEVSAADPTKGIKPLDHDTCNFDTCTGADKDELPGANCKWKAESPPGDIKLMMFKCAEGGWSDLKSCKCHYCEELNDDGTCKKWNDPPDPDLGCDKSKECKNKAIDGKNAQLYYEYGSWYLTIGFDYKFDYNAKVSLPVEVMREDLFLEKLTNKEIRLESKESQYTGGPVKLTIWTQKQPLRSDELSYGRISLINGGKGKVTANTVLTLYIPKILSLVPNFDISKINLVDCVTGETEIAGVKYISISCKLENELDEGKYASLMFSFKYKLEDTDTKSLIFIGNTEYTYKTLKELELAVMKAPLAQ